MYGVWRLVTERGMQPLTIVKDFDVLEQRLPRRFARGEGRLMNEFLFDRGEQRLRRSVVPAVRLAAHAAPDAELGQLLLEVIAGILHASVRMRGFEVARFC